MLLFVCVWNADYSYDFNMSESDAPPTTYLPEDFTYLPSQVCPERMLSMSKCAVNVWIQIITLKVPYCKKVRFPLRLIYLL